MRTRGLDVSVCQGTIDYDQLPDWVRFLVVNVSNGITGVDADRMRNLAEARRRGLKVFVYHFFHSDNDAEAQAANLWAAVGNTCPALTFIDLETIAKGVSPAECVAKCLAMVGAIKARFGRAPGIYTYPSFAKDTLADALFACEELAECPLWMADYRGGESPAETWRPYVPKPWTVATFVQTSGDFSSFVSGIAGHVDHDYFDGSEDELEGLMGLHYRPEADALIVHDIPDDLAAAAQARD